MMARMTTTTQKKNTMMPGIAYPATVLALATAASYPTRPYLFTGAVISVVRVQRRTKLAFLMADRLPGGEQRTLEADDYR
jgi:hypothetical protein